MDRYNAFPDAKADMGRHSDEFKRAHLQFETGHKNLWGQWFEDSAGGLKRFVLEDLDSCRTLLEGCDGILINYGP